MRSLAGLLVFLMIAPAISGCFGGGERSEAEPEGPFVFSEGVIPATTWYHYPGTVAEPWAVDATDAAAIAAANITANLTGGSTPFYANGTYYGTGWDTFEPTIGITSSGAIFFTNYNGLGDGTHIIRSRDQGQTWEDVGPFGQIDDDSGQTPNSNDPYLYVDKFTDRLVKFDMHVLVAMFVEYSDDDGETWSIPYTVEGYYQPQDHQSIASMPVPDGTTAFHEVLYIYCINTGSSANGRVILSAVDCMDIWLVAQMVLCIEEIPLAKGQPSTDHWMVAIRGLNTPSPRLLECSRVGMPTRSRLRWMKVGMCTQLGSEQITSHGTPTRVTKVRLGVSR